MIKGTVRIITAITFLLTAGSGIGTRYVTATGTQESSLVKSPQAFTVRNRDDRIKEIEAAACTLKGEAVPPAGNLTLWYRQPATQWVEALPVGNGRLGAMVYGGVNREWLQLNEDTIWSGRPIARDQEGVPKALEKARELLFAEKYVEAQKYVQDHIMGRRIEKGLHTYQTLGDLELIFPKRGEVSNYRRDLDLSSAIARVQYTADSATYTREVFSSAVDQAIVVRFTCDQPGRITFDATLSRPADATVTTEGERMVVMSGEARASEKVKNDGVPSALEGVDFQARCQIAAEGGQVSASGGSVHVVGADSATLILTAATDYYGDDAFTARCAKQADAVAEKPYDALRNAHIQDYSRLFERATLDLGGAEKAQLPTDERLLAVISGAEDPHLVTQYFQFGRYLLISSSRPGTQPANLQGLWADALVPPWNADYHININIQMNYWPAELTNLSECHDPFFYLIERLRAHGGETARNIFDCRGWTAGHTTDAWFYGSLIGLPQYGMWPTGGAWTCQHMWEHYAFTGDREFLSKRAYPAMKGAAEFCLDWLVEDPDSGYLVSGPSTSPENRFKTPGGGTANLVMGPTMDHQIMRDLFNNCVAATKILDIDAAFRQELETALKNLAPTRIGKDGRILEWAKELEEHWPGHRHISHLFGLHPGREISVLRTPKMAAAAQKTLDYRLANGGGHTGWSRAWVINLFARLHQGDRCHENIQALLAKSTLPNLFDNHPPFQIDGNFGATAGIAEMLMQSHAGAIELLPALPKSWTSGRASGFCARGGFDVDVAWEEGSLNRVVIKSKQGNPLTVKYGDRSVTFDTVPGAKYRLNSKLVQDGAIIGDNEKISPPKGHASPENLPTTGSASLRKRTATEDPKPDKSVPYKVTGEQREPLHLEIFLPDGHQATDNRPAIIFFFGGGWTGGSAKQFYQQAHDFAKLGLVAVSADYRTAKSHGTTPFECVQDGKSAIRWMREHADKLGINPDKIIAAGGSAGGHVAACTGVIEGHDEPGEDLDISSVPNAMILYNPVIDTTEKGYGMSKVGQARKTEISPCHKVRKGLPPTLVVHGTADTTVPFENVERFTRLMKEAGNLCVLVPFEGKRHGFFNGSAFRPKKGDGDYDIVLKKSHEFLRELKLIKQP